MLRSGLRPDERGPAVCGCGRPAHEVEEVIVHRRGGQRPRASVSGVYRCGSGWLCPTCSRAVAQVRQARVQRVVQATTDAGGHFVMGLLTVSHGKKDSLADLKALVQESWAAARRGAPWERVRDRAGVAGILNGPETTHGCHGWHFHIHFGMPCLTEDEDVAKAAGEALVQRFMRAVQKRGGKVTRDAQGVEIAASPEAAGEYIAKGTAWELAAGGSDHKSRTKGRTHWDIAEDAAAGDDESFRLFREYADVMPGTRSCVVTSGMAAALGIDVDEDDEYDGEEQQFEDGVAVVGTVPAETWKDVLRGGLAGTLLARVEDEVGLDGRGWDAVLAWAVDEARQVAERFSEKAWRPTAQDAEREARASQHLTQMAARRIADKVRDRHGTVSAIRRAIEAEAAAAPGLPAPTIDAVIHDLATEPARRPIAMEAALSGLRLVTGPAARDAA